MPIGAMPRSEGCGRTQRLFGTISKGHRAPARKRSRERDGSLDQSAAASRLAAIRRRIQKGGDSAKPGRLGALEIAHSADPGVGTDYVIDPACDLDLPQQRPPGPAVGAPWLQVGIRRA